MSDLETMIALARAYTDNGRLRQYFPALDLALARTVTYMAEHWEPKRVKPTIIHASPDTAR